MKCPYCDQEIEDGSVACSICGKEISAAEQPEMVGEAASQEAVTPEPPKSNKKIFAIAAVAVAVGVVAVGAFMATRKSGKDIVIDAFKSIVAEGQTDPMEEIFGWEAMNSKLAKEDSETTIEFQLQDSSDETVQSLSTGKFGMTVMNDPTNKKMYASMGVGFADMNLANLEFYLDDKQLVAAVPELSSKAFALNYADDLEGQMENSPFLGEIMAQSGIDLTGFNNYLAKCNEMASSGEQLFDINTLWTRYKEGSKAIDDLKAAMTVANAEKKSFTIDGKEVSLKGYNVTITKDALMQFATTTKDFFLTDETLKKDFVEYMSLMLELQGSMAYTSSDMSDMTPEQIQDETWKSVDEQANSMLEQLKESMGDLNMVVYARKDGKMASFDYSTTAKIDNEDIKIYGTVAFTGGYNMFANVDATMTMEDLTGDTILLKVGKTGAYEAGKSIKGETTMSIAFDGEEYGIVLSGDYTVDGGAYNLGAIVQANGAEMGKLTSTGMVQDLVKGESLEVVMDSIKVESSAITGANEYVDLSGFYKVGPLTSTINMPTGDIMDILAASESDWETIGTEIMGNAYGIMMGLEQ